MQPEKKIVIIDQKKFKKDFLAIKETEKDRNLDDAFLCPHCKSLYGTRISRSDPTHLYVDPKTGISKKIVCDGEKEFWLQKYYDDILRNIPLHVVPEETILTDLYVPIKDEKSNIKRSHLQSALIIGENQDFFSNLKCFVKKMVWEHQFPEFSYAVVSFSELRNMRLDKNESFAMFDNRKLVIIDLTVSSHISKLDSDIIKEFIYSRESKFLPLWVLNPDEKITNKNVEDVQIRRKLENLRKVKLSSKASSIEEVEAGSTTSSSDMVKKTPKPRKGVGSNFQAKA